MQDALGVAPMYAQIRIFASRIFIAGGSVSSVKKHWLESFLRRNPYIRTLQIQRIDTVRVNGATVEVI